MAIFSSVAGTTTVQDEAQKAVIAARDAYMEATQLLLEEPLNAKALQLYVAASERLIEAKVAVAIIPARD